MLVPLSWLKDYVDIDVDIKELEEKLFSSIHKAIRNSRKGKLLSYSKNYGKAVTIVLECLEHTKSAAKNHLNVSLLLVFKCRMFFCKILLTFTKTLNST